MCQHIRPTRILSQLRSSFLIPLALLAWPVAASGQQDDVAVDEVPPGSAAIVSDEQADATLLQPAPQSVQVRELDATSFGPVEKQPNAARLSQPSSLRQSSERTADARPIPIHQPKPSPTRPVDMPSALTGSLIEIANRAYALARTAKTRDDYTLIINLCNSAAERFAHDATSEYVERLASWAYNRRGEWEAQHGNREAAARDFDIAVQLEPTRWRAVHNRAISFAENGDLTRAMEAFDLAIELKPDYGPAYRNRGEAHFAMGEYAEAVRDYSRAIEYLPRSAELYYVRGETLHRLGKRQQALADYNRALQVDGTNVAALVGRGIVRNELGQHGAAVADIQAARRYAPNDVEAMRALAWIRATCADAQYRRPAEAIALARQAIRQIGQEDAVLYDTLAAAYAAAGDFRQARGVQRRAVRLAAGTESSQTMSHRLALYDQEIPYRERVRRRQQIQTQVNRR